MSLKQILQNAVIYPVIIGQLFLGAYRCGNDVEPNPDTQEDSQVLVDSGHDKDAGLEDKLIYPDANGDKDILDSDVPNGDNYQPDTDTYDGGLDASDVDITDVPQYDGGDVDLTDVPYQDAGGDNLTDTYVPDGGDAGQGIPPVVIMETKDKQGNIKDTFNVGEYVVYDVNKSYDPDCEEAGTCGSSKGMDYCEWSDDLGNAGKIYFPDFGKGVTSMGYGTGASGKTITATAKCYDLDDKLSSVGQATIHIN